MTVLNDLQSQVRKQIVTVLEPLLGEPNDGVSRAAARLAVEKLSSMSHVVCDATNNTPTSIDQGHLIVTYTWNKTHRWNMTMTREGFSFEQIR